MGKISPYIGRICLLPLLSLFMTGCGSAPGRIFSDSRQTVKVLSYNVWEGFRQDGGFYSDSFIREKYVHWVGKLDPDIVAYQEMGGFSQGELEDFAKKYAHPFAVQLRDARYPVSLSSKYPIVNVQRVFDNMHHGYLYGISRGLHIFVVHFSSHSYQKRQKEVETVLAHAALLPDDEMIMILGDFNALSAGDSAYYTEAYLNERREMEGGRRHNLHEGNLDFSVIGLVEEAGFQDIFKMHNDEFKTSVPTVTKVEQQGPRKGSRIDFAFANPTLARHVVHADIIHDEDTHIISDHYPVYFEIRFPEIGGGERKIKRAAESRSRPGSGGG